MGTEKASNGKAANGKTSSNGVKKAASSNGVKKAKHGEKNSGWIIDIRLYLLIIVLSMTGALFLGVTYGPSDIPGGIAIAKLITKFDIGAASQQESTVAKSTDPHVCMASRGECLAPINEQTASKGKSRAEMMHAPSGHHLMLDMMGIESDFLDSEERLTKAMIQTVEVAGLTIVSHHCHKLVPNGVSCVGVLLESHISFHTWPEAGAITLDLFTCGDHPLVSLVPTMQELFGVGDDITSKWSHELRGFSPTGEILAYSDLSHTVLSPLDLYSKREVYTNVTKYHKIDVWDVLEYEDSPNHDLGIKLNLQPGDPRWESPELVEPYRQVYVDGALQSLDSGTTLRTECLVHPGMFAHPYPSTVAIVGDPDGDALREVLKHKTVQAIKFIENDAELMSVYQKYIPQLSDCSDLIGRPESCFDDEIVETIPEDFFDWFVNSGNIMESSPKNDVVVIENWQNTLASKVFSKQGNLSLFVSALMESLSNNGVVVLNVGSAPDISQPKADIGVHAQREELIQTFENNSNVAVLLVYENFHDSYFHEPSSYLIVCKDASCRNRWYSREDVIEYELYSRIVATKSKMPALTFYDGPTQRSFQNIPRAWETVYCRREPMPFECAYRQLDTKTEIHNLYLDNDNEKGRSSFELKRVKNTEGELEGPFVFATVDIPKGSYIMPGHLAPSLLLADKNLDGFSDKVDFVNDNIHTSETEGSEVNFVEVGGTTLILSVETEEEANVGRWVPPHPPSGVRPAYSPVYERHRVSFDVFMVATKDIPTGTQLFRKA